MRKQKKGTVFASSWKKRHMRLTETLLVWGRAGAQSTSVPLASIAEARLVSRYGEFAVELTNGSSTVFRCPKGGMREATTWIVAIKERAESRAAVPETPRTAARVVQAEAPPPPEEWPAESESEASPTKSAESPVTRRRANSVVEAPTVFQPKAWAQVETGLWWKHVDEVTVAETVASDPLGLAPDDVLDGHARQDAKLRLADPSFDPNAFLATVHGGASFAQLQAGSHNLKARLGSHDHKLQVLVRENLTAFLAGADKVHSFILAFDKLVNSEDGLDDISNLHLLAAHAGDAVSERFDPLLRLLDRTAALHLANSLLVLFAPLVDGPDRPDMSQRRWRVALRRAAASYEGKDRS